MSQRYLKRANWEIYLFDKKRKTSILTFIEFQNQARLVWYKGQEKVIAEIIGGGDHSHSSSRQQDINQIVGWSHPHQPPSYKSFGQSLVIPSKHVIYKKVASDSLKLLKPVLQYFWMKLGKLVSRSKLGSTRLQVVLQTFGGCVTSALLEVDSPSIIPFPSEQDIWFM